MQETTSKFQVINSGDLDNKSSSRGSFIVSMNNSSKILKMTRNDYLNRHIRRMKTELQFTLDQNGDKEGKHVTGVVANFF